MGLAIVVNVGQGVSIACLLVFSTVQTIRNLQGHRITLVASNNPRKSRQSRRGEWARELMTVAFWRRSFAGKINASEEGAVLEASLFRCCPFRGRGVAFFSWHF